MGRSWKRAQPQGPAPRQLAQGRVSSGADTTRVAVGRPTLIAWLVVPAGAVDTLPDLAVVADDWNYAMATLGDSLAARGIAFAMATGSQLRLELPGASPVTIRLGRQGEGGYVFARPGMPPCVRRSGASIEEVLEMAGRMLGPQPPDARARAACDAPPR